MEEPIQKDPLREAYLLSKMREKQTDELLAIWQQNDRQVWSEDAFEAIHKVLQERLIEVPEQALPAQTPGEGGDLTYLNTLARWAKSISWVIIGLAVVSFFVRLLLLLGSNVSINFLSWILVELSSIAFAGFAFIVLQAVAEIIYFLLDRKAGVLQDEITAIPT